ncbi:MAG: hypothetical protein D6740_09220, partial [Alphaproteobacteria bacterium]
MTVSCRNVVARPDVRTPVLVWVLVFTIGLLTALPGRAQTPVRLPDAPLDCGDPPADKPAIPDGRTASRAEMLAAVRAVKHFSDEVDQWLACKDKRAAKVFQWMNEDQRARWEADVNAVHNDRVALQRAMNAQIRLFNARLEAGSDRSVGMG